VNPKNPPGPPMTLGNIEIVLQSVSARSERLASLKVFAIMAVCALGVGSAHAQSLRIAGAAGYASEWELSGVVTQVGSTKEFSGPLTFTHVGLCTVDGPLIKSGQIKFEVSGSKLSSKIQAAVFYEGAWCAYDGKLSSSSSHGFMRCSEKDQIPITLIIK
jgi:hypothetical protein